MYWILVNYMLEAQIRQSMEVYVDDLLVKSKEPDNHVEGLWEAFVAL